MTSEAAVPAVQFRALTRRFGRNVAVREMDLAIPPGGVIALVGRNGAGKTTAVKMLLGLLRPTSGDVKVLGLDPIRDRLQLRLRSGYVPDKTSLYPWMKVTDVLELASALHPRWESSYAARLVDILGLPVDRKVKALSRGELAQLSFVIAAAPKPELLVLDEPTSGLDPIVRHALLEALRDLASDRSRTILFSTHVMPDVDGVAERAIIVDGGRILAEGSVDALKARHVKASILFDEPPDGARSVPGARRVTRGLREWIAIFDSSQRPDTEAIARELGAKDVRFVPLTFDEVFLEMVAPAERA